MECDTIEGTYYSNLYLQDKSNAYPHIGLIDSRTGELLRSWTGYVGSEELIKECRS